MSTTTRRGLGPGVSLALATAVRPPRNPLPWSPAAIDGELRDLVAGYEARAGGWREEFEDLDEDALTEAAVEARALGTDPVAAVDQLVRGALLQLDQWDQALAELGRALIAAARQLPLPEWATDTGREGDTRLRQARERLLAATVRYHHGGAGPAPAPDRPW